MLRAFIDKGFSRMQGHKNNISSVLTAVLIVTYIIAVVSSIYLWEKNTGRLIVVWHISSLLLLVCFLALWLQINKMLKESFRNFDSQLLGYKEQSIETLKQEATSYVSTLSHRIEIQECVLGLYKEIEADARNSADKTHIITFYGAATIIPSLEEYREVTEPQNIGISVDEAEARESKVIEELYNINDTFICNNTENKNIVIERRINMSAAQIQAFSSSRSGKIKNKFMLWIEKQKKFFEQNLEKPGYSIFTSSRYPEYAAFVSILYIKDSIVIVIGDGKRGLLIRNEAAALNLDNHISDYVNNPQLAKNAPRLVLQADLLGAEQILNAEN